MDTLKIANGRILKLLETAGKNAMKSEMCFKHGAVCTKGRKVFSSGFNTDQNRFLGMNQCSLHAEVNALGSAYKVSLRENKVLRKKGKVGCICS